MSCWSSFDSEVRIRGRRDRLRTSESELQTAEEGRGMNMNRRFWLRFAMVVLGLAMPLILVASAQAAKRVALVIGNNDYKNVPKLQKAVNDARAMGETLKQLGFSVMLAENQTRQAFSETLLAFDKAVEPANTPFFFYAGHGFEMAAHNFLLP